MVVERSLVAPQPCYSSSASVFHDHERREGKRRRKGWNEDGEGSRMRYFFGLLFRRTGILHGVGRGRDNGIGWPPLLPRNDTLRGYNSPDRPTVSRPILLSGGKGEARTKSDSVLLFFLRFSSSNEASGAPNVLADILILEIVGRGAINRSQAPINQPIEL